MFLAFFSRATLVWSHSAGFDSFKNKQVRYTYLLKENHCLISPLFLLQSQCTRVTLNSFARAVRARPSTPVCYYDIWSSACLFVWVGFAWASIIGTLKSRANVEKAALAFLVIQIKAKKGEEPAALSLPADLGKRWLTPPHAHPQPFTFHLLQTFTPLTPHL